MNSKSLEVIDFQSAVASATKSILFIDPTVDNYQTLISGTNPGIEVVILDTYRDGIQQMTETLVRNQGVKAVHIVSHGTSGCLYLGNSQLNLETIENYTEQLQQWGEILDNNADILIYGCNVAADLVFVQKLRELTGANIAASATPTGSAALGGDWELEVTTGEIEVSLAFSNEILTEWKHILAAFDEQPYFYQVISGQLRIYNPLTGDYEELGVAVDPVYNATGYNIEDNFLYGIQITDNTVSGGTAGNVIRINSDGTIEDLGFPEVTGTRKLNSGDVDDDGNLWVRTGNTQLTKINLTTGAQEQINLSGPSLERVVDLVYNSADQKFYGAGNQGGLYTIDLADNSITRTAVTGFPSGQDFGAAWIDRTGAFYVSQNNEGKFYRIDDYQGNSPNAVFVSNAEVTSSNDGMSDPRQLSPFEVPFIDPDPELLAFTNEEIFTEGDTGVGIVDDNVSIQDFDGATVDADGNPVDGGNIQSATITLTNPQTDDQLFLASALPGSITADISGNVITLTTDAGGASPDDFETALKAIQFRNTSDTPDRTPREVDIQLTDTEDNLGNTATTTINVVSGNNAPSSPSEEPNDILAEAIDTGLTLTNSGVFNYSGEIGDNVNVLPENDVDLFKFDIDIGEVVKFPLDIELVDENGFFNFAQVELFDASGNPLFTDIDVDNNQIYRAENGAETLYIGVSGFGTFYDPSTDTGGSDGFPEEVGSYDLTIETVGRSLGDDETNDILAEAIDTGLTLTNSGVFNYSGEIGDNVNVLPENDVDLFKFDIDIGEVVKFPLDIELVDENGFFNFAQVELFDASGNPLFTDIDVDNNQIYRAENGAETLYIGVSGFGTFYDPSTDTGGSDGFPEEVGSYDLTIETVGRSLGDDETNDILAEAIDTGLTLTNSGVFNYSGEIGDNVNVLPENDVDLFKFDIDIGEVVKFPLDIELVDENGFFNFAQVELFDASGNPLFTDIDVDNNQIYRAENGAETLYIGVSGFGTFYDPSTDTGGSDGFPEEVGSYDLTIETVGRSLGDDETNDILAEAIDTGLTLTNSGVFNYSGEIGDNVNVLPENDVDLFKFDIDIGEVVKFPLDIELVDENGFFNFAQVELFDASGNPLFTDIDVDNNQIYRAENGAETLYIGVSGFGTFYDPSTDTGGSDGFPEEVGSYDLTIETVGRSLGDDETNDILAEAIDTGLTLTNSGVFNYSGEIGDNVNVLPENDVDLFKFDIDIGEVVKFPLDIELVDENGFFNFAQVELFDASGNPLFTDIDVDNNQIYRAENGAETLYIGVSGFGTFYDPSTDTGGSDGFPEEVGSYDLTIETVGRSLGDDETNDILAEAIDTGLTLTNPGVFNYSGEIGDNVNVLPENDVDLFKFDIDIGEVVKFPQFIELVDENGFFNIDPAQVKLFDDDGNELFGDIDPDDPNGIDQIYRAENSAQTLYIGVSGFDTFYDPSTDTGGSDGFPEEVGSYDLTIETVGRSLGDDETNDILAEAIDTGLTLTNSGVFNYSGEIGDNVNVLPENDVDLFKFDIDIGEVVKFPQFIELVDENGFFNIDPAQVKLFDDDGNELFGDIDPDDPNGIDQIYRAENSAETLYIGVSGFGTFYDPSTDTGGSDGFPDLVGSYDLTIETTTTEENMTLNPGDIAFVQYNADGTDNFKFVALVDIPESEEIKFTDKGRLGDNSGFSTGEGTITWIAPAGGISAGTVVEIDNTPSASVGTVSESGSLNFAATGDQIIAYQGTNTAIAALNNEGTATWQTDATDTNTSALPQGLTNGTDAVAIDEIDNAIYTGITTGDRATLLAAINDNANWTGDNSTNQNFDETFTIGSGSDSTPPTVETFTPVDNASAVAVDANLAIDFDEDVEAGTGNIVIKQASNNSTVNTIDVTSSQVSISNDIVTINPTDDLAEGTEYYVEIAAGAIEDTAGNDYTGVSGPTDWNFTTASTEDTTPPTVTTLTPSDNTMGVAISGNLEIQFDEDVVKGTNGDIVIKQASNDQVVETISVSSAQVEVNTNTVTIDPSSNLDPLTEYYVEISSGAFQDTSENDYQGISGTTTWNFTTAGETIAIRRGNAIHFDGDSDGTTDRTLLYGSGAEEDQYLVGDWDGDNTDEIAVRRGNEIHFDDDSDGTTDRTLLYGSGAEEDQYLVGDWDGDNTDEIAVRRGKVIHLDDDSDGATDRYLFYGTGAGEDQYLVGDWDGDNTDEIAVRRGKVIHLDDDSDGATDRYLFYGTGAGEDQYLAGDWDHDGIDEIALRRGNKFLMNYDTDGRSDRNLVYGLGNAEDEYLIGVFSDTVV